MNRNGTWQKWANGLKRNIYGLYLASQSLKVPLMAKVIIGLVVAYALCPIDLIPDFIPVIGDCLGRECQRYPAIAELQPS